MNNRAALFVQAIRGPILLITVGALFAMQQASRLPFSRTWPLIIIVIGIMKLFERMLMPTRPAVPAGAPGYGPPPPATAPYVRPSFTRRMSITGPLVLIAIGVLFLIHAISPEFRIGDLLAYYWPYLLIMWGVIALIEACVLAMTGSALPVNGVSGGGWAVVILICVAGMIAFEFHRPDTWWRNAGWTTGVQAFGEEHEYPIDSIQKQTGNAPHIVIETFRGDAKITVGTEGVSVSGHKTVKSFDSNEADKSNAATPVEVAVEGNTVTIRCNQDRASSRAAVTTDLEISVPKDASIEASGTYGDFDISGITGNVNISSDNAGVRLEEIGGSVSIDTRRSDLLRCTNVTGAVDLRGKGEDVELSKIAGQVTIEGDYSGTVSLRELAKPLRVRARRTQLEVQQTPGEIRLEHGDLNAENVVGPLKVNAHDTDVTLNGFTNSLELSVDKGDIDLKPARVPLGNMTVHTHSGNIELSVPAAAAFAITASTDHGDIDNEFGDALQERSEGHGAKLEGSVGGGPELRLATERGSVTVRKAGSGESSGSVSVSRTQGLAKTVAMIAAR